MLNRYTRNFIGLMEMSKTGGWVKYKDLEKGHSVKYVNKLCRKINNFRTKITKLKDRRNLLFLILSISLAFNLYNLYN